jgi:protein SCO1
MKRGRERLLITVALGTLALAGAVAAAVFVLRTSEETGDYRGSQPPALIMLPDFTLPDYRGEIVSSSELEGKVALITFLDSQCTEACPIIASQIARTLERLQPDERAQVMSIAISTDPVEDSPTAVREFLRKHRAEGTLRYLVAPVDRLRPVWEDFQIAASFDTGIDTLHSAPVRIYDRDLAWVSTLHAGVDLTPENLAHDIRLALGS